MPMHYLFLNLIKSDQTTAVGIIINATALLLANLTHECGIGIESRSFHLVFLLEAYVIYVVISAIYRPNGLISEPFVLLVD